MKYSSLKFKSNVNILKLASIFEQQVRKNAIFIDADSIKYIKIKLLKQMFDDIELFVDSFEDIIEKLNGTVKYYSYQIESIISKNHRTADILFNTLNDFIRNNNYENISDERCEDSIEYIKDYILFLEGNEEIEIQLIENSNIEEFKYRLKNLIEDIIDKLKNIVVDLNNPEEFIKKKIQEAGEQDWRPVETVPEDYYAL